MKIDEKLGNRSIASLQRVSAETQERVTRVSNLLILMLAFGVSIAIVAYCFVNGHSFVGVWLAATFLAWAFLFGAAERIAIEPFASLRQKEIPLLARCSPETAF